MQTRARRQTAWVAIFAIALQAFFAGLPSGLAIASTIDPATIICHSDASDNGADRQPPPRTHDCCKQCVLCSTLSAGTAPDAFVVLAPSRRQTAVFIPFAGTDSEPFGGFAIYLARGPPHSV